MLSIQLMNNSSPVEKIGKTLSAGNTYNCALKDNTSVLDPVIIIQTSDNIYTYNYMYISDFGRYYFINDIVSLNNNRWMIKAHVDVLETYKVPILNNNAVNDYELFKKYTHMISGWLINSKKHRSQKILNIC